MLYDSHCPIRIGNRFKIDIIGCALQVFHPKVVKDLLLLSFENTDVEGIRTQNPVAFAVDNLDREIYSAVTILYDVVAVKEFPLYNFLHLFDDLVEP